MILTRVDVDVVAVVVVAVLTRISQTAIDRANLCQK
jgi:hypothetical protein